MARGKRNTINRKEQMLPEDKDEREDEDEEEEDDDAEASDDDGGDEDSGGDDDDEDAPKKKPKKKAKTAKTTTAKPKRPRAAKVVRMRAFWGVFNNSNTLVAKFDYAKKKDAEEHAAKLHADKGGTYFVIQQKEPME
jgi:hypothetical protein